jgi:solute carrier family 35 protein F1/2
MICVAGLGLLVASDQLTNKDWAAPNKGKGDAFMILGATLYGFSASCTMMFVRETDRNLVANATEEFLVRRRPLYEVVGQLGMWGTIINGIQASALEHKKWKQSTWSGENSMSPQFSFLDFALTRCFLVGLLVAYTAGAHFVATWSAWY